MISLKHDILMLKMGQLSESQSRHSFTLGESHCPELWRGQVPTVPNEVSTVTVTYLLAFP